MSLSRRRVRLADIYTSLTSYPDNAQVGLIYTDPMTGQNHTCDSSCPLYTDSSIVAQDFIFADGAKNMTGLQMQLKTWQGAGAGLGSVQLLTDGRSCNNVHDTDAT